MKKICGILVSILFLCIVLPIFSNAANPVVLKEWRGSDRVVVDGYEAEYGWSIAQSLVIDKGDVFVLATVKFAWDKNYLYIFASIYDSELNSSDLARSSGVYFDIAEEGVATRRVGVDYMGILTDDSQKFGVKADTVVESDHSFTAELRFPFSHPITLETGLQIDVHAVRCVKNVMGGTASTVVSLNNLAFLIASDGKTTKTTEASTAKSGGSATTTTTSPAGETTSRSESQSATTSPADVTTTTKLESQNPFEDIFGNNSGGDTKSPGNLGSIEMEVGDFGDAEDFYASESEETGAAEVSGQVVTPSRAGEKQNITPSVLSVGSINSGGQLNLTQIIGAVLAAALIGFAVFLLVRTQQKSKRAAEMEAEDDD